MRMVIPLSERKLDYVFIVFFLINALFITTIVDLEQLVIADPAHFSYPIWPPRVFVDLVHWYGSHFDPPLMARPAWWRATIWIDELFFLPFYVFGIRAFILGKDSIRNWAFLWSGVMMTNVFIICFEETLGATPTPALFMVLMLNLPWFSFPILMLWRMWKTDHPFTREVSAPEEAEAAAVAKAA